MIWMQYLGDDVVQKSRNLEGGPEDSRILASGRWVMSACCSNHHRSNLKINFDYDLQDSLGTLPSRGESGHILQHRKS